jgi:hypothetical protein
MRQALLFVYGVPVVPLNISQFRYQYIKLQGLKSLWAAGPVFYLRIAMGWRSAGPSACTKGHEHFNFAVTPGSVECQISILASCEAP